MVCAVELHFFGTQSTFNLEVHLDSENALEATVTAIDYKRNDESCILRKSSKNNISLHAVQHVVRNRVQSLGSECL